MSRHDQRVQTIVIGHRNPDLDSCAAAAAYAALKTALGETDVSAACAGIPSARAEFLFRKFGAPLPRIVEDVSPKVRDVMDTTPRLAMAGQTLLEAMEYLRESQSSRIPVTDNEGKFVGMVSIFDIAGRMFQKARNTDFDGDGDGVVGRCVRTSIALAAKTLNARISCLKADADELADFNVYVGAMSLERLENSILAGDLSTLAVVVGDRHDLQRMLIERGIKLLILTGNSPVDLESVKEASRTGVSILQTPFDSATTVRRLKFCQPVESMLQEDVTTFAPEDNLKDIRHVAKLKAAEVFPVVDDSGHLVGCVSKYDMDAEPPLNLVLVDHNELDQAVNGADQVPVVEVVDHHRLGLAPTNRPIKVTNDIVGSTSTLVAEFYRRERVKPTTAIAGVLLGGVVSDTLLLRSPTTTDRDRRAVEWLEKLCGVQADVLNQEIYGVGSVIANQSASGVIHADKKDYKTDTCSFSISQVEEASFESFETGLPQILKELQSTRDAEGLDVAALLVTDVVRENSRLLVVGNKQLLNAIPYHRLSENLYDLPDVLSRKKQLLPTFLKVFAQCG